MDVDKAKKVNVQTVIERAGVQLKRSGSVWMGLCPLHGDKATPSLVVYPATNSWACFGVGCGNKLGNNGGDVIEWVRQKENLRFRQAVEWLTDRYHLLPSYDQIKLSPKCQVPVIPKAVPIALLRYWHSLLNPNRRSYFHKRGFVDDTIDDELWGWHGKRYVVPVWDWEPQNSACIGVRLRKADDLDDGLAPKYIGLTGFNVPTVYGKVSCKGKDMALAFAGEFDCARAIQDGFAACSMVNGANVFHRFPEDWPNVWFPDTQYLVVVFDKKEEVLAGRLAEVWGCVKGTATGRVFHWPPDVAGKDYCEFRDDGGTAAEFKQMIVSQLEAVYSW